jgi:hypothetical protein
MTRRHHGLFDHATEHTVHVTPLIPTSSDIMVNAKCVF